MTETDRGSDAIVVVSLMNNTELGIRIGDITGLRDNGDNVVEVLNRRWNNVVTVEDINTLADRINTILAKTSGK
jgi:hypothetical protein